MYDNVEYLNLTFPAGLTPEQQFNYVTDTAKVRLYTIPLNKTGIQGTMRPPVST